MFKGYRTGPGLTHGPPDLVSFKHPSFRSEYEMRLVVSPFEKEGLDIQPCYHVSKERIKKYYPLDLKV